MQALTERSGLDRFYPSLLACLKLVLVDFDPWFERLFAMISLVRLNNSAIRTGRG